LMPRKTSLEYKLQKPASLWVAATALRPEAAVAVQRRARRCPGVHRAAWAAATAPGTCEEHLPPWRADKQS
jgi:hypothetical protein